MIDAEIATHELFKEEGVMARFLFGHIKKRPLQPIGSTESPPLTGKSDVDSALNVFLTAKNWRDAIDVLGTQEAVLLTDDARKVLLQRIKQLRKHSPKADSVKKLRLYLRLLDEVRAHGIDAGWDSFFFYLVRRRHRIRWAVLQLIFRVFPPMQRKMKELSKQVLQQNLPSNSPSQARTSGAADARRTKGKRTCRNGI